MLNSAIVCNSDVVKLCCGLLVERGDLFTVQQTDVSEWKFVYSSDNEDVFNETPTSIHLTNKGQTCPTCGSDSIEGCGGVDINGPTSHNGMGCLECDAMWSDIYTLSGIEVQ